MTNTRDYIVRATAANSQIRAFAIQSKNLVEKARQVHHTSPVATADFISVKDTDGDWLFRDSPSWVALLSYLSTSNTGHGAHHRLMIISHRFSLLIGVSILVSTYGFLF